MECNYTDAIAAVMGGWYASFLAWPDTQYITNTTTGIRKYDGDTELGLYQATSTEQQGQWIKGQERPPHRP